MCSCLHHCIMLWKLIAMTQSVLANLHTLHVTGCCEIQIFIRMSLSYLCSNTWPLHVYKTFNSISWWYLVNLWNEVVRVIKVWRARCNLQLWVHRNSVLWLVNASNIWHHYCWHKKLLWIHVVFNVAIRLPCMCKKNIKSLRGPFQTSSLFCWSPSGPFVCMASIWKSKRSCIIFVWVPHVLTAAQIIIPY